jgi:hypothetical protein
MGMFATQIMSAGTAAVASGKKLVMLQYDIYKVQAAAANARNSIATFNAVVNTTLRVLGPLVLAGGLLHLFQKRGEHAQKTMDALSESTTDFETVMSRMEGSTKLFSDDALARTLGISNYEMHELANNTDLTESLMNQVRNSAQGLSGDMQKSVAESLNLLEVLNAMQTGDSILDRGKFYELQGLANEAQRGFLNTNLIGTSLRVGGDERQAIRDFYDAAGVEMQKSGGLISGLFGMKRGDFMAVSDANLVSGFVGDLTRVMEEGYKFSAEELEPFADVLGPSLFAIVKQMNELVNSSMDADYNFEKLKKSVNDTSSGINDTASEIQNLTDEIYNFSGARSELFFGGSFGNVTGSLYKQVVTQGVGTLYHKNEIIMSNNFHGFFNEREAAAKIIAVLDEYIDER